MNYLKHGQGMSSKYAEAKEKARPLTPKSERRPAGRIAPIGVPNNGCPGARCVLKPGHSGEHWPK